MNVDKFLHALAMTESNDNPNAELGDHGRALGRWQVHPDRLWDEARRQLTQPALNEIWDMFIERVLRRFYLRWTAEGHSDAVIAMNWHMGHFTYPGHRDWDVAYAERFQKFYEST